MEARKYLEDALDIVRRVEDREEEGKVLNGLSLVYDDLGKRDQAKAYLDEDRWEESKTLNHMVRVYQIRGQREEAQQCFEAALALSRKTGDRREEARILNSLVRIQNGRHLKEEVQKDLEQALIISREVGDLKGEGLTQHNLGRIYYDLGKEEEAHKHYKRAYHIRRKVGDSRGVAWTLRNVGELYHKQRHLDAALASLLAARQIFDDVQSPDREEAQKAIDSLRKDIGRRRFNELSERVTPQADQIVRTAFKEEAE